MLISNSYIIISQTYFTGFLCLQHCHGQGRQTRQSSGGGGLRPSNPPQFGARGHGVLFLPIVCFYCMHVVLLLLDKNITDSDDMINIYDKIFQ